MPVSDTRPEPLGGNARHASNPCAGLWFSLFYRPFQPAQVLHGHYSVGVCAWILLLCPRRRFFLKSPSLQKATSNGYRSAHGADANLVTFAQILVDNYIYIALVDHQAQFAGKIITDLFGQHLGLAAGPGLGV